jgi:hypothetical protein
VENEVMCPVCGTPLNLAEEAPQAERERAFIEREIDRCRSKAQIKRALVAEFGESVLALPGDEGDDDDQGDECSGATGSTGPTGAIGEDDQGEDECGATGATGATGDEGDDESGDSGDDGGEGD